MNELLQNSDASADTDKVKLRLSVICVFLSDTVNSSCYTLPDGTMENIHLENDSPIYPPYGINLKINGQDVIFKNIFENISENIFENFFKNSDIENFVKNVFFMNIITPAWGAWTTDEAKKNTEKAAKEAFGESRLNSGFVPTIKVYSGLEILREKHPDCVVAHLTDSVSRFYPPTNKPELESFSMKSDFKELDSAMQHYWNQRLAVYMIYDDDEIKKAAAKSKTNKDILEAHSVSDIYETFYNHCRQENEQKYFTNIKLSLTEIKSPLFKLASECEGNFKYKLLEIPKGWTDGTNKAQSFFTVFFDSVYIPTLQSYLFKNKFVSFLGWRASEITKSVKDRAVTESEATGNMLTKKIKSAADQVYTETVIKEAVGCLEDKAGTEMINCKEVKKAFFDKLNMIYAVNSTDIIHL